MYGCGYAYLELMLVLYSGGCVYSGLVQVHDELSVLCSMLKTALEKLDISV